MGGSQAGNHQETQVHVLPRLLPGAPRDPAGKPAYFIVLQWAGGQVRAIRDFRHARYAIEAAEIFVV